MVSEKDNFFILQKNLFVQWESEIWHIWSLDYKVWFQWSGLRYCLPHLKTRPFKIQTFWSVFQIVRLPLQTRFQIRTICNPTSFQPIKIQTSPDFRSPVWYWLSGKKRAIQSDFCPPFEYQTKNIWILTKFSVYLPEDLTPDLWILLCVAHIWKLKKGRHFKNR